MPYSLLITFREGLEAALIIAIVLGYLGRLGQRALYGRIWLGAAIALLGSLVAGVALELLAVKLSGAALEALEGITMFLAVGVLTWMIFWMRRQAATLGGHLRSEVDTALKAGSGLALALLAFSAVGREGLETVLFLFAGAATTHSGLLYWIGGGIGLALATVAGYLLYKGTARLPLRAFFDVTGVALIVLAAGLLVGGLKEFREMGLFPTLGPHLWDTYSLLPDNSILGRFLAAVLGYDSSPMLIQVILYWTYLVVALALFFLGRGRPRPAPAAGRPAASSVAKSAE